MRSDRFTRASSHETGRKRQPRGARPGGGSGRARLRGRNEGRARRAFENDRPWKGIGGHDGGPPQDFAGYGQLPTGTPCGLPSTDACFLSSRFDVTASYLVFSGPAADGHLTLTASGAASVRGQDDSSAVFYFFAPTDWEILAKMPAGTCGVDDRFWFFSAAASNLHYELSVYDNQTGTAKLYFNFAGPPAPAVTDTAAFATCP